jgi:hypothetical protein
MGEVCPDGIGPNGTCAPKIPESPLFADNNGRVYASCLPASKTNNPGFKGNFLNLPVGRSSRNRSLQPKIQRIGETAFRCCVE